MTAMQKSVPALRFKDSRGKDYPDWEKVKFKCLYSFKTTNSFSRNKLNYVNGKVRNLHYGDIHTKYQSIFVLERENVPFLNLDIDLNSVSEDAYCKEGDLVIADASEDYNGIGKTIELLNLNGESVLAGLHTLLAKRNSDRIHIGYGAYVMACNIVRQQIMRIAQGTKVLGISIGRMNEIELPIPSKKEQQKITAFLSPVDAKIEQLTKKRVLLKQYKKGMMQKLFGQEVRFKNEKGRNYPDWEEIKAGQVFTSCTNRNHNSDLPILAATQDRGVIPRDETGLKIQSSSKSIVSYKVIEPGDFVISLRSFQGGIEYCKHLGIGSPAYTVLKPIVRIDSDFFRFYFKKEDFISRLSNTIIGIRDGKQIPYGDFAAIKLNVPSLEEQQKIAAFLSSIDKKIEFVVEQIKHAKAFKKGLLQQMFV